MATGNCNRSRELFSAVACASALLLGSCGERGSGSDRNRAAVAKAAVSEDSLPMCGGTAAHDRHQLNGVGCTACHPCGGIFGFTDPVTYAGGTTSANGTLTRASGTTTCSVGCHSPFGAAGTSITWSTAGPLACSACHSQVAPAGVAYRSAHAVAQVDPAANRAACQSCHDTTQHTRGHVRIDMGDGTVADASVADPVQLNGLCQGCHDGTGRTISDQTPPVLPGWTSSTGDFHGSRAGTGFGGTLLAPFQVGQGPLACTGCHDPHASANAFLFAANVNGAPVPTPSSLYISRGGVGAEALCMNCHQGNRHAGCMTADCHGSVDPAPAGKPCFFCHGHEGMVNFALPTWDNHPNGTGSYCWHCHSPGWFPAVVETTPPRILSGPTVTLSASTATITWTTDEISTSYVEYGTSSPGTIVGDWASPTTSHAVTLSGLCELTTYGFRVRSSDRLRNVMESATASFTTPSAHAPPAPAPVPQPNAEYDAGSGTATVPSSTTATFQWSAVTAPDGHAVQYRFQLSSSPSFATTIADAWQSTNTAQRTFPVNEYPGDTYYWRVQARDSVETSYVSSWSATDSFDVYWYMPY
jgi:predicted CXXCH cytochrome family protein